MARWDGWRPWRRPLCALFGSDKVAQDARQLVSAGERWGTLVKQGDSGSTSGQLELADLRLAGIPTPSTTRVSPFSVKAGAGSISGQPRITAGRNARRRARPAASRSSRTTTTMPRAKTPGRPPLASTCGTRSWRRRPVSGHVDLHGEIEERLRRRQRITAYPETQTEQHISIGLGSL